MQKYAEWAEMFRWRYREFAREIASYIRPRRILDVGCGSGIFMEELGKVFGEAEICGVDVSEEFCRMSGAIRGNASNLPFKDGSFDLITFTYSIHDTGFSALLEARRCMKKGGCLALRDVNSGMSPYFKAVLLSAVRKNVGESYAKYVEKVLDTFPKPIFVREFVGEFFNVRLFRTSAFDFDIIATL